MIDPKKLSRLDCMSIAMGISEELKPEVHEWFQGFCKDFLDRVAISYFNTQAQKQREYREQREHREQRKHRDQPRFISDQPVADPTIPTGGGVNDLRIELNEVKGAFDLLAKQLRESDERAEARDERLSNQMADLIGGNAWEQTPKESWIEKPEDS